MVPHPLAGQRPEVLRKVAEAAFEEVARILTAPAAALAAEYEARPFPEPKGSRRPG
jgi:hypothetical protein